MTEYADIDLFVWVTVDKYISTDIYSDVNLDGWTADAGADASADGGYFNYFTMAEAYTDAHSEVGYSEASSFSAAAVDPNFWC